MTVEMKSRLFPMLALAVAAMFAQSALSGPARAQDTDPSLDGFSLPPSQRQPEAQGPVTDGVASPRAPRPTPRPAPQPPAIAIPAPEQPAEAAPAPTAPRAQAPAPTQASPRAMAPATGAPAQAPTAAATPQSAPPAAQTLPSATPGALPSLPTTSAEPIATPAPAATAQSGSITESATFRWGMLAALLVLVLATIALAWHRFVRSDSGVSVPVIEPPRPRTPQPAPTPAEPGLTPAQAKAREIEEALDQEELEEAALPLRCAFEVTRLSVTLMKATLAYRITLTNMSDRLIRDVSVGGDMVSAHSSLSMEQQMANEGEALEIQHKVPAMLPGQSIFLSGDLALPIRAIRVVRKGDAALFVPLARLKIEAEGLEMALLRTSLVGQRPSGPGAGLRPFRLDLGPRIYSEIGQKTLAVPA